MAMMTRPRRKRDVHNLLLHRDHIGCSFWESPDSTIIVVFNPSVEDLVSQAEEIIKCGYQMSGGIQLVRRDTGTFNASATFRKIVRKPVK